MKNVSIGGSALDIPFGQFIDGVWRDGISGRNLSVTNPFTREAIGQITLASTSDLDAAYRTAHAAQRDWAAALPRERAAVMSRVLDRLNAHKDSVIAWIIAETGGTRVKAELEFASVQAQLTEFSSLPYRMTGEILPSDVLGKESRVYRRPVGVVGVISPWNWPITLSHRSIGAALSLGNAVVVKPADETPVCGGLLIARLYEEAGLPKGLLNIVVGEVSEIGDQFTQHAIPRVISFTGSTGVGRRIVGLAAQAKTIKHVILELGGNAPFVVLDDADVEQAVAAAIFGRFLHQGQICMSTNRILVQDAIYDRFVDAFVAHAARLKAGDPSDPATNIGPIISQRHFDRLKGLIDRIGKTSAKALLTGEAHNLVLPAHVYGDVLNGSELAQSESFGPIAPIIRFTTETEGLQLANDTEYGLSSSVFSADLARAEAFSAKLDVGITHINDATVNTAANAPFGGEKNSGLGRFGGDWMLREFTTEHWLTVQRQPRRFPF